MRLLLLLLIQAACLAQTPVISGLAVHHVSATTGAISWTTDIAASTALACSTTAGVYTKAGVDDTATTSTAHYDAIAGLAPSTTYYCRVTSTAVGSTTATISFATSATVSYDPITSVTLTNISSPQPLNASMVLGYKYNTVNWSSHYMDGDTMPNAACNDGNNYIILNDTHGIDPPLDGTFKPTNAGSNTYIAKFSGWTAIWAAVNALSSFGTYTGTGADGRVSKGFGLSCLNDNWSTDALYMLASRQTNAAPFGHNNGGMFKSLDYGATWANWSAPSSFNANGNQVSPVTTNWLGAQNPTIGVPADAQYSTLSFVSYLPGGPITPYVHQQDVYVYIFSSAVTSAGSYYNNADSVYLMRMPRSKMPTMDATAVQWYTGGDGTLDASWSAASASATPILTKSGQTSAMNIQYIPALGRYVGLTWWYQSGVATSNATQWIFYESPTPWGPFTEFYRRNTYPQGWFAPMILQGSVSSTSASVRMASAGDYGTFNQAFNASTFFYTTFVFDMAFGTSKPYARISQGVRQRTIPRNGLVAWYDATQPMVGGTLVDSSGNGNTVSGLTVASVNYSEMGGAVYNGGSAGEPLTIAKDTINNAAFGDFTQIMVWRGDSSLGTPGGACLACKTKAGGSSDAHLYYFSSTLGLDMLGLNNITWPSFTASGQWYMIAARRTGTLGELWANGSVRASATVGSTALDTTAYWRIGGLSTDGTNGATGYWPIFAVWNRSLPNSELAVVYSVLQRYLAPRGIALP